MKMNSTIKKLRKKKGLSQEELSERVGVSLQTIRRWEWGATTPNSKLLSKLAGVLDTTPECLLSDNTGENDAKLPNEPVFRNTGISLVYERNGERMELPPTEESYAIFRDIAARIAGRESSQPAMA